MKTPDIGLTTPNPVLVSGLFPQILQGLLEFLRSLSEEQWGRGTVCAGWTVKDVALHLLGVEIGNLSYRRDGLVMRAEIGDWKGLVAYVNDWNQNWVAVARRISPPVLVDLLELTGAQMCAYFQSLDPYAMGGAISWVDEQPQPVWLDLAREYTERWHHQQHIRDAVGRAGFKQPEFLSPALEAFLRALPRAYEGITAQEDACVTVTISGEAGSRWSILRQATGWQLYAGAPATPDAEVTLDQEVAWRLFTRGISRKQALEKLSLQGDRALGLKVLEMVSIIA